MPADGTDDADDRGAMGALVCVVDKIEGQAMNEAKPDIMPIMESEGIELRQRGHAYWGRCPFHMDRSPSFKVSPERQSFYCFGCGERGDGIDFVMKRRGISFVEALKVLGIRRGRPSPPDPSVIRQRELKQAFDGWCRSYRIELSDETIRIHALKQVAKDRQTPLPEGLVFILAGELAKLPVIEHRLDVLFDGDEEAVFGLFQEVVT